MQTKEALHLNVARDFLVPKDVLYSAWTDPDQLKQWWKPMGKLLLAVENDIREGGEVAYHFEDDLHITGRYQQVTEGEKLVYTWQWKVPEAAVHDGDYVLTVQFLEQAGGSRLEVEQNNIQEEHAVQPHELGWQQALDDLDRFLQKQVG